MHGEQHKKQVTSSQCSQEPSSGGVSSSSSSESATLTTHSELSSGLEEGACCCSAAGTLVLGASASLMLSLLLCCWGCFGAPCWAARLGWSAQPVRRLLNSSAPHALRFASGLPLPSGSDWHLHQGTLHPQHALRQNLG